jgi:amino acid transporter
MYILVKVLVSAFVIGIVTEIARRFPSYGGIVAALPLVSLLSLIWL